MADDVERRMFDGIMGSLRPKTVAGAVGSSSAASSSSSSTSSSSSSAATLGVVLQRLSMLETENEKLKGKLAKCRCSGDEGRPRAPERRERKEGGDDGEEGQDGDEDEDEEELRESDRLWLENRQLKEKLAEMEQFLLEYGLVWVGSEGRPASSSTSARSRSGSETGRTMTAGSDGRVAAAPDYHQRIASAPAPAPAPVPAAPPAFDPEEFVDFPVLFLRIQQLNELVGAGKARVVNVGGVHKFEVPKELPLYLYREGIVVGSSLAPTATAASASAAAAASTSASTSIYGRFRRYDEESVRVFLQDILDGYFPSELRNDYPEGVPFCLIDKHAESHPSFASQAAALNAKAGSLSGPWSSTGGNSGSSGTVADRLQRLSQLGGSDFVSGGHVLGGGNGNSNNKAAPMTTAALLNALPNRVIAANGSLVEVKKGVQELLSPQEGVANATPTASAPPGGGGGGGGGGVGIATAAAARAAGNCLIQLRVQQQQQQGTFSSSALPPSGSASASAAAAAGTTVTIQVPITGTVKDLRAAAEVVGFAASVYELRTAFPRRAVLEDDGALLSSCALAPNGGVVHLHLRAATGTGTGSK